MLQFPLSPTLANDLQEIDRIVRERTRSRAAVISVAGAQVLQADADRLRAALVLLSADLAGGYESARLLHAAAAVELIHAATQTHDDLVDAAERRRGVGRNEEWNSGVALMVGDYLFALASVEMAMSPDARVISTYSQAVMQICEAQLAPAPDLRTPGQAREQYLAQIRGLRAALPAAACRAGALCGGATPDQVEALGRFGEQLGLLQTVASELREFADPDGPIAPSLKHGLLSLPLIHTAGSSDADRLLAALDNSDPAELSWAMREVSTHGISLARADLLLIAEAARLALEDFPATPARSALLGLVEDTVCV